MVKGQVQKSTKMVTTYGVKEDIQARVERTEDGNGYLVVTQIDILEPNTAYTLKISQKQARCLIGILKTMESDGVI